MNKLFKSPKQAILVSCFIAGFLIFNGCSPRWHGQKVVKEKNFVSWEIEFKANTSDSEKAGALTGLDKYILNSLHSQHYPFMILSVHFSNDYGEINQNTGKVQAEITLGFNIGNAGQTGASELKPGPHGPKRPLQISLPEPAVLQNISPSISAINLSANQKSR